MQPFQIELSTPETTEGISQITLYNKQKTYLPFPNT